jgi:transcriptional regulator with XRE-family HTH domain
VVTQSRPEHLLDLVIVRGLARTGAAREIRTGAGLSLADVGGAIGVAAATVQRWENGLRRPYGEAALRYGALLGALRDHLNDARPAGEPGAVTTHHAGGGGEDDFP